MVSTTIRFNKPDVQPPVYVAGSFSKWAPIEMNVESNDSTGSLQNHFSYRTDLEPGTYDYKFRLGPGDWWVLDESSPCTRDDAGNVNNVLSVESEEEPTTTKPEPAETVTKIPAAELRAEKPSPSLPGPQIPETKAEATNSQSKSQPQSQVPANIGQKIVKDEEPKAVPVEKSEKNLPLWRILIAGTTLELVASRALVKGNMALNHGLVALAVEMWHWSLQQSLFQWLFLIFGIAKRRIRHPFSAPKAWN